MKKSNVTLRGIVVAGDSRQEAEDNYRAVATGSSVSAFQDNESQFVILSNADSELTLMNPLSGEMNLVEASDIDTDRFEFVASDADETVTTFYTLCSEGCGSHLIADDPKLMQRCPVCASDLADLSEDEIQSILAADEEDTDESDEDTAEASVDEGDVEKEPTALMVVAGSFNEAVAAYRELAEGEKESRSFDCESGVVVSSADSELQYSPYTGEAASELDEDAEFSAEASADGEYAAHWYQCASEECGQHVIASSESPVFCPSCSSGLIEPEEQEESTASDEEDYDAALDDLEAEASDESEDFEEGDIESTSGDDEDCEDEEDEDLDEEEDEDDEEEDDEDDDFDDENSMSVSSVTIEEEEEDEMTASDEEEDEEDYESESSAEEEQSLTSVATNLLSLASAEGDLETDKLEVAFAGDINGEGTWVAFYNAKPVALATASTSTVESSVFNAPSFGNLVHASAKENGVEKAFNELGFTPVEASVDVDSYVQDEVANRVEVQVAEARSNFEKSGKDYTQRFEAAVATAAQGINKNFFEDVNNPIKGALVSTMTSLGIRGADRLVAQAFAKHNDTYLRNLVAKAGEIMDYDVSVQNQLTKAVAGAAAEQVATASADSESLSIGKPVQTEREREQSHPPQESTASSEQPQKPDLGKVLSTLGRRGRN